MMSRGYKILIGVVLVLVAFAIAAPFAAHSLIKNKIDTKLNNEFGDMAHYDDIQVSWSPLGATLTNLRFGNVDPRAGNEAVLRIASANLVLNSIFDSEPHFKNFTAKDLFVNIFVDERGESSAAKLVREKKLSTRTKPLTIDNIDLEGITITTYVAKRNPQAAQAPATQTTPSSEVAQPTQPASPARATPAATTAPVVPADATPTPDGFVRLSNDPNSPQYKEFVKASDAQKAELAKRAVPASFDAKNPEPAPGAPTAATTSAAPKGPDSILKVASVHASGYVIPVPGKLLGYEKWIPTTIENIEAMSSSANANQNGPAPLHIGKVTFELDQAETTEKPVKIRHFKADQSTLYTSSTHSDRSGFRHVTNSLQKAFGLKEPKEISESSGHPPVPHGTGLWIEDFESNDAVIEIDGGGNAGKSAYWRLKGAQIKAGNLAFGEKVQQPTPGFLKVESVTESPSVPGHVSFSVTDISGSYPNLTFKCAYHVDNVDVTAFSSMAESAQHVEIEHGSLSMDFNGGANAGQLSIQGNVTLSSDFTISGSSMKKMGVELERGKPIDGVTIDGTINHPQIHLPKGLAMLGELMGNLLGSGPLGILDETVGQIPVIGSVVKETTKVVGKIPIIGGLLGGDKDKK